MKDSSKTELSSLIKISKAEIKRNQRKSNHLNEEDAVVRRDFLKKIIESLEDKEQGVPPSREKILEEMEKIGFKMTVSSLYRERLKLANKNTYVSALFTEGGYSELQESNRKNIELVIAEAIKCFNQKWTANKTVHKLIPTKEGMIEHEELTETEELAAPKAKFLEIILRGVELLDKHAEGKNKKLGTALLGKQFRETREKLLTVEVKNQELNKEVKALLEEKKKRKS